MTPLPEAVQSISAVAAIAARADHVDVKTYRGRGRMDAFIIGFMSYYPAWIKALYGIRRGFVRLLGMKQYGVPDMGGRYRPEDLPMTPGQRAQIFVVESAEAERYWFVSASDKHLTAYLCIAAEQAAADGMRAFHVVTLVVYNNWAGPVYFNVIRPFHHLVVARMSRAGLKLAAA